MDTDTKVLWEIIKIFKALLFTKMQFILYSLNKVLLILTKVRENKVSLI